jgi:hypothetical protein
MGEAKRRGSMNERAEAAKDRESGRIAAMAETMNIQFDEDQYLYCLTLYQAAAGMSMPVENPENKKIRIEGYGTVAFTDNAMNRGMLAVSKELTDQGMDHRERMAMVSRVMHFGDIVEAKDRFSHWIKPSTDEGALSINEALMRAGATARIIVSDDHMGFDLDDVERLAESIAKRLDDEDGGVSS